MGTSPEWLSAVEAVAEEVVTSLGDRQGGDFSVYLVLLQSGKVEGVYVGHTELDCEARFLTHKSQSISRSNVVFDYGVRVLTCIDGLNCCEAYWVEQKIAKSLSSRSQLRWVEGADRVMRCPKEARGGDIQFGARCKLEADGQQMRWKAERTNR